MFGLTEALHSAVDRERWRGEPRAGSCERPRVFAAAGTVKAFDAAGTQNCSGAPKVCTPLWTSPALGTIGRSSPIVANGVLYIGSSTGMYALEAANGGPPLWSLAGGFSNVTPALVNGVLYVGATTFSLP